jgi:mono/diheme cytochrome c family protein
MGRALTGLRIAFFAGATLAILASCMSSAQVGQNTIPPSRMLHARRHSASDLELSGDLKGRARGSTRYITRDELLELPQATFTVTGDADFSGPTKVSGVPLEELAERFAAAPSADLVLAICSDRYCAPFTRAYLSAHGPLLVLTIDGQPPARWPKAPEGNDMGPYLISNPPFTPSFKILSQEDEAQIPWGVLQIEFRNQADVWGAIAPRGRHAKDPEVQDGYRIAQQNCFRCHNMGSDGGRKSGLSWRILSIWAKGSPKSFAEYIRDPKAKNPGAQMPGNPEYDDATLHALVAYFQTFSPAKKAR